MMVSAIAETRARFKFAHFSQSQSLVMPNLLLLFVVINSFQ